MTLSRFCRARVVGVLGTVALLSLHPASALTVWLVKAGSSSTNTGTGTWSNAFPSLDTALSHAVQGDQIWVAEGTYKPLSTATGFSITVPLGLYGGFGGIDTTPPESLTNRGGSSLLTFLDGEEGSPTNPYDNARHVISISELETAFVTIDGFVIQNGVGLTVNGIGQTDGAGIWADCPNLLLSNLLVQNNSAENGGGLWIVGGCFYDVGGGSGGGNAPALLGPSRTLNILNSDFVNNFADTDGGAIYGQLVYGQAVNVMFKSNSATNDGGAVKLVQMQDAEHFDFTNCVYLRNHCHGLGGGLCLDETSSMGAVGNLVNCTMAANYTTNSSGGQAISTSTNSVVTLYNDILYFNYLTSYQPLFNGLYTADWSDFENITPVNNNISADPQFRSLAGDNLHLRIDTGHISPCIEHADYGRLPADTLDADGNGNTTEIMPVDFDLASRTFDLLPNTTYPNNGTGTYTYLDMGAFERH